MGKLVAQKIAIIGAGVSGLASIKCCLDAGLQPTCFEQQSWLGALWKYCDEPLSKISSVHQGTVTNTSKALTNFSDFPMPKEYPNYMSHRHVQRYLEMYAEHFGLTQYIRFDTVIEKLSKTEDHAATGRWIVSSRKLKESDSNCDETEDETFDAVVVCNGHHWDQASPNIPGLDKFKGDKVHSGDFRTFHPFVGKRVVVVGCGNSAGDIACELSHHASQVYLSTRSGCFLVGRMGARGRPIDMQISRLGQLVPLAIRKHLMSGLMNKKYNMANLGLEPTGSFGVTQFPIINDELPDRVITGSIIVKSDIKETTETAVVFRDEDVVDNVDALVFCTGFKLNFPFADDIIPVKENYYASLYKHVFLPDVDRNTLAVIGAVGVPGPVLPVAELQARVAAEVFAGRCFLPSREVMVSEVQRREQHCRDIGLTSSKFMRVGFVDYLDELANMIGAKPDLWSLLSEDPTLALRCFFGPCVPAQYRLQGPNSKDTRPIINSVEEDFLYPLKTRMIATARTKGSNRILMIFILAFFLSVIWAIFR